MRSLTGVALCLSLVLGACQDKREQPAPAADLTPHAQPKTSPSQLPNARAPKPTLEQLAADSGPLSPKPAPQTIAGRKLVAQRCTINGRQFLGKAPADVFKAIEVTGNRVLVVDKQGQVNGLLLDPKPGCTLAIDERFGTSGVLKLPEKTEHLSRDGSGRVFASNGIFSAWVLADGKQQFECETKGHVQMHASGSWGIAPWLNATVRLVEVKPGGCHSEDWVLKELKDDKKRQGPFSQVDASAIVGDLVLIGGVLAKSEDPNQPRVVMAYTRAGKERFRFGNLEPAAADAFAAVSAIEPCKPGVCVLDGDKHRLSAWTRAGKWVGAVDLSKLFGISQAAMPDFAVGDDGSAWFVTAAARDAKVAEGIVYRVRGL